MNVIDYVKKYGNLTFKEKEFNEIDNAIFNLLHYIDFYPIFGDRKSITIKESYEIFKSIEKDNKHIFISTKRGEELLEVIHDYKRYRDIELSNYEYIKGPGTQFSALTFKIKFGLYYVSFEGTDQLMSGWEEDCRMAYKFPVKAEEYAISYLNKHFTFKLCKIIVGGHSKGGHLALVGSMYSNFIVRFKTKMIYSNDGQGLRKEEFESKYYKRIKKKFIHIIPNNSIVGLLLYHDNDYKVIKSNRPGILAHDIFSWQVIDDHFEKSKLSRFSRVFEDAFIKWISKYSYEEIEKMIDEIFKIAYANNILSVMEFELKKSLILGILKTSKEIDEKIGKMVVDLFKIIGRTNLEYPLFK